MRVQINSQKTYNFIKYFTCSAPLIFCFMIYITDNVNYNNLFELRKYSSIAKYWLGDLNQEFAPGRLPIYPLFIALIYKIFGVDNYNALLFFQAVMGFFSFLFLIKTLEELNISRNIITLSTIFLNFSMIFRFSVFLPNCLFIFVLTILVYFFTKFYFLRQNKYFFLFCLAMIILLLTRPIFQFIIFFTVPFVIYYLIKTKKRMRYLLISFLLISYLLGMGIQVLRNYHFDRSVLYTSQSAHHFFWIIACLSKKYACGKRDMKVMNHISDEAEMQILKVENPNLEIKNRIRMNVGKKYIINEMNKIDFVKSAIFSYLKVIFHSALIEIYGALNFQAKELYISGEDGVLKKFKNIVISSSNNPLNLFWLFSIASIILLRILQLYGFTYGLRDNQLRMYTIIISSMITLILINAIGLGNPRYRSEAEPLLIILSALAMNQVRKILSKNK